MTCSLPIRLTSNCKYIRLRTIDALVKVQFKVHLLELFSLALSEVVPGPRDPIVVAGSGRGRATVVRVRGAVTKCDLEQEGHLTVQRETCA